MGNSDLTFCSMFPHSLFNHKKNNLVVIFISQISYKQREHSSQLETKVPAEAKHGTEVVKQTECFGCSSL